MKEILCQPKLISLSGDLENVPLRLPAPRALLTEVSLLRAAGRHWSVPGRSKTSLKASFGSGLSCSFAETSRDFRAALHTSTQPSCSSSFTWGQTWVNHELVLPKGICWFPGGAVLGSVTQSCLTLCDPMGCSPPDSSVHGIP